MSLWQHPKEHELKILKTKWNHILNHIKRTLNPIHIKHKLGPLTSMYFFKMWYYTANPTNRRTIYVMLCAIWYHSYNLKNVKNTHGGVLLLVKLQALLKVTLLHGCFSCFLNCAHGTKSRNAPYIFLYKEFLILHVFWSSLRSTTFGVF